MDSSSINLLSNIYRNPNILKWDPAITYKINSIVTYKGQLYKSFGDNKGELPITSKNWISIK